MTETIYISLLDEGTTVRRPARAYRRPDGAYIVLRPPEYNPDDEIWEYPPGSSVICESVTTSDGKTILAAVRPAQEDDQTGRQAQTA